MLHPHPFASENDLNDNMTKSMKQQMKIASIGVNKSTTKNKLKTSSNQNINAMVDPNGKAFYWVQTLYYRVYLLDTQTNILPLSRVLSSEFQYANEF